MATSSVLNFVNISTFFLFLKWTFVYYVEMKKIFTYLYSCK